MTATASPFGFRAAYHPSGIIRPTAYNPGARAAAAAIYQGDPVKLVEDGTDFITIAGNSDAIIGVFAGCEYVDGTGKPTVSNYWPGAVTGATSITFYVVDDAETVFEVQANGSVASSAVGDQADSVVAAGSTATGISGTALNATLVGAGNQGQWRIVGVGKGVDNAWGDTKTIVQCKIANHQYVAPATAI